MKKPFVFLMLGFSAMSFTAPLPKVEKNRFEAAFAQADAVFSATYDIPAVPFVAPVAATPVKYQYGFRKAVTLTSDTLITVNPANLTLTYGTLALDTNAVITTLTTSSIVGDRIILQITADASNRQIDFRSPLVALDDSVVANKTKLFEFIFNGTNFVQLGELQIN